MIWFNFNDLIPFDLTFKIWHKFVWFKLFGSNLLVQSTVPLLTSCCIYISFDLWSFHSTVDWWYNSSGPLPGSYRCTLFEIKKKPITMSKPGVAKPLPGGKKVPAKTLSSALWTFLKIKFVEKYREMCNIKRKVHNYRICNSIWYGFK